MRSFRWYPSSMLRLLVTSIIVFLCVVGQAVYTATAVAGPPPCTNYEVGTQNGSIKSEIRPYEGDPSATTRGGGSSMTSNTGPESTNGNYSSTVRRSPGYKVPT